MLHDIIYLIHRFRVLSTPKLRWRDKLPGSVDRSSTEYCRIFLEVALRAVWIFSVLKLFTENFVNGKVLTPFATPKSEDEPRHNFTTSSKSKKATMGKPQLSRFWRVSRRCQDSEEQTAPSVNLFESVGITYVEDDSNSALAVESVRNVEDEVVEVEAEAVMEIVKEEDRDPSGSTPEQHCAAGCDRLLVPVEIAADTLSERKSVEGGEGESLGSIPRIVSYASLNEIEAQQPNLSAGGCLLTCNSPSRVVQELENDEFSHNAMGCPLLCKDPTISAEEFEEEADMEEDERIWSFECQHPCNAVEKGELEDDDIRNKDERDMLSTSSVVEQEESEKEEDIREAKGGWSFDCRHPSEIIKVAENEDVSKEPQKVVYCKENETDDPQDKKRSFLDLFMCNIGEELSVSADPFEDRNSDVKDEPSDQGEEIVYQGDTKSEACSVDQRSVATEKLGNISRSVLAYLDLPRKVTDHKKIHSGNENRRAPEVESRRSRSELELDTYVGRNGIGSKSIVSSRQGESAASGAPESEAQASRGDSISRSDSDTGKANKKENRLLSFLRRGGTKADSDSVEGQMQPSVVEVPSPECPSGDSSLDTSNGSTTLEGTKNASDGSTTLVGTKNATDGSTTLEGTVPPDEYSLMADSITFDFYDKMDMIRQMTSSPLYLYRERSYESTQTTKAHMAVYEVGEMIKDVPLTMSTVKKGVKFMGRQLSEIFEEGGPNKDMIKAVRSISGLEEGEELTLSEYNDLTVDSQKKRNNLAVVLKKFRFNAGGGCIVPSCMAPIDAEVIAEEKEESTRFGSESQGTVDSVHSSAMEA